MGKQEEEEDQRNSKKRARQELLIFTPFLLTWRENKQFMAINTGGLLNTEVYGGSHD